MGNPHCCSCCVWPLDTFSTDGPIDSSRYEERSRPAPPLGGSIAAIHNWPVAGSSVWEIVGGKLTTNSTANAICPKRLGWPFTGPSDVRFDLASDGVVEVNLGDSGFTATFNFATGRVTTACTLNNTWVRHCNGLLTSGSTISVRMCGLSLWINGEGIRTGGGGGGTEFYPPAFVMASGSYAEIGNLQAFASNFSDHCPDCHGCPYWPVGPKPTAVQITINTGHANVNDGVYILDPIDDSIWNCTYYTDAEVFKGSTGLTWEPYNHLDGFPATRFEEGMAISTGGMYMGIYTMLWQTGVTTTGPCSNAPLVYGSGGTPMTPPGWATVEPLY